MKNTYNRLSFFGSVLFNSTVVLLFAIFTVSYFKPQPNITALPNITYFGETAKSSGFMFFKPNIDLTNQFDFNTKQIFLYVICYNGKERSEMCWSKLIQKGDNYKIFDKYPNNYNFSTKYSKNLEFELFGNIYPYVGKMKVISYGKFKVK